MVGLSSVFLFKFTTISSFYIKNWKHLITTTRRYVKWHLCQWNKCNYSFHSLPIKNWKIVECWIAKSDSLVIGPFCHLFYTMTMYCKVLFFHPPYNFSSGAYNCETTITFSSFQRDYLFLSWVLIHEVHLHIMEN